MDWVKKNKVLILTGLLLLALLLPPFFRGLFFPRDKMVFAVLMVVLTAITWLHISTAPQTRSSVRGEGLFLTRNLLDVLVLGLALAYVVSSTRYADLETAIITAVFYLSLFFLYWIVSRFVSSTRRMGLVLYGVFLSTVFTALYSLTSAAGIFLSSGNLQGQRLAGSLQYANAMAAFMMIGILLGLGLLVYRARDNDGYLLALKDWREYSHLLAVYFMTVAFLLTASRGATLVLPIGMLALVALTPKGYRSKLLTGTIVILVGAAVAAPAFSSSLGDGPTKLLAVLGAGALFVVGLGMARGIYLNTSLLVQRSTGAIVALISAAGVSYLATTRTVQVLGVLARLGDITLADYNAYSRLIWARDAFRIVLDYPVFGAGGGGWTYLYRTYQSYGYWTSEAHNHFMQTWVEVGTVGFLVFLGIWVALLASGLMVRRRMIADDQSRLSMIPVAAMVAALSVVLHSVIEFSLSLGAVTVAVWALIGVVRGAGSLQMSDKGGGIKRRERSLLDRIADWVDGVTSRRPQAAQLRAFVTLPTLERYFVPLALTAMVVLSSMYLGGLAFATKGVEAMNSGDLDTALKQLQVAESFNPWSSEYHSRLADIYSQMAVNTEDREEASTFVRRAAQQFVAAVTVSPHDPVVRTRFARFALNQGDGQLTMQLLKDAVGLGPHDVTNHERLAEGYYILGQSLLLDDDWENAEVFLKHVETIYSAMLRVRDSEPEIIRASVRMPETTPMFNLTRGKAKALIGDWEAAELFLSQAAAKGHPEAAAQAKLWLGCIQLHQLRSSEGQGNISDAADIDPGTRNQLKFVFELLEDVKDHYELLVD